MKKAMVRPILVRGVAAFALVGTLFGVAAQSAGASTPVKVFVRTNGSDSNSCLGASVTKACQSVSHATSVADAISASEQTPGSPPVIVEVKKGIYYDTIGNSPTGAATSPAGITISEPHITITKKGGGTVTIEPTTTESALSVEDTTPQNVLLNVVGAGSGATISKVTINGIKAQNSFTSCSQDFVGVYFGNSSGTLSTVKVLNVQQPVGAFGCQPGANGDVYAASCVSSCPNGAGSATVNMTAVTASMYDKTGITCSGAATACTITGSTVTGSGQINDQAQNGIEDDYGATANITTTTVSGDSYTCNGVVNGACYSSSGILAYEDGGLTVTHSTVTSTDDGIVPYADQGPVVITNNTVSNGTDANVDSAQGIEPVADGTSFPVTISNNIVNGDVGGGIYNYATGPLLTEASNTAENDSATEVICTITAYDPPTGPLPAGCASTVVGGGVNNYATTGGTVGPGNIIENNAAGGVIDTGAQGGTIGSGAGNTISNNAGDGVELLATFGATVSNNTLSTNGGGGVVAEDPPAGAAPTMTDPCAPLNPAMDPCQNSGNAVTNNVFSGTSGAGIQLELTGGFSISGNNIQTAESGPGVILVGSDNSMVSTNTVSFSQVGIYVGGNDLTGPSVNNTVNNNAFSSNELGGGVADGPGSPESWNRPGTANQGIQGQVFFQSSVSVAPGYTNGDGSPLLVTDTTTFGPGDYSGVAEYLAGAGAICGIPGGWSPYHLPGVPVDQDYTAGPTPNLFACTDGAGNIYVTGDVIAPITGVSQSTANTTTTASGSDTLTLTALPCFGNSPCTGGSSVAAGNTFNLNVWANETLAGAIDGSGPNSELPPAGSPVTSSGSSNATIQNVWTNNTGSPSNSSCNPSTALPECGL